MIDIVNFEAFDDYSIQPGHTDARVSSHRASSNDKGEGGEDYSFSFCSFTFII